jgi:hypothetical protein
MADWRRGITEAAVRAELDSLHRQGHFGGAEYRHGQVGVRFWNLLPEPLEARTPSYRDGGGGGWISAPACDSGSQVVPSHAAMCTPGLLGNTGWKLLGHEHIPEHVITEDNAQHIFLLYPVPSCEFKIVGSNHHCGTDVVRQALANLRTRSESQGMADWRRGITEAAVRAELDSLHRQGHFGGAEYCHGQVGVRFWNLTGTPLEERHYSGGVAGVSWIKVDACDIEGPIPARVGGWSNAAMCTPGAHEVWRLHGREHIPDHVITADNAQHIFLCPGITEGISDRESRPDDEPSVPQVKSAATTGAPPSASGSVSAGSAREQRAAAAAAAQWQARSELFEDNGILTQGGAHAIHRATNTQVKHQKMRARSELPEVHVRLRSFDFWL